MIEARLSPTGYDHPSFAESLAKQAIAIQLAGSEAWLIERPVGATGLVDLTGLYPVVRCANWSALHSDIIATGRRWVSVSLVTDPLSVTNDFYQELKQFDVARKFKEHYLVDLTDNWQSKISKHHRYAWRRARKSITVRREPVTPQLCEEWAELYLAHTERKSITGPSALDRDALTQQLRVPGIVTYRATTHDNELCGMALWANSGKHSHYHLAASTDIGYALGASYALVGAALEELHGEACIETVNLGGGAGLQIAPDDGLTKFKRGWTKRSATAYFIGQVTNKSAYESLTVNYPHQDFFPLYRASR